MAETVVAGNLYDKYGTKNPIARRLMAGFLGAVRNVYDAFPGETVVEIGCGEGELLGRLQAWRPARRLLGVDVSPAILREARSRHGWTVSVQSADGLALRDGIADVVVACEVLEHVPDPDEALREIARVARRRVILSVPREPIWRMLNCARLRYLGEWGNTPGHIQHFSRGAFVELVARHLRVIAVRSPLPWTVVSAEPR